MSQKAERAFKYKIKARSDGGRDFYIEDESGSTIQLQFTEAQCLKIITQLMPKDAMLMTGIEGLDK